ncbi:MAG: nickel-binding protein [Terracidiphilus sp.]
MSGSAMMRQLGPVQHSMRMRQSRTMPQFVIERDIPGAGSLTEEQLRQVSLQSLETLKNMGPHIQWLHSYVTEDKVYSDRKQRGVCWHFRFTVNLQSTSSRDYACSRSN